MPARSGESLIARLYMKGIRANQMKGHFAHFLQRLQDGIIAGNLTYHKILF